MSEENRKEGRDCYAQGDASCRDWFERQWRVWPKRVDQTKTTNLSFHHGAVLAFREIHSREPVMSNSFSENVRWLDKYEDNRP